MKIIGVRCVLTITNRVRYITINTKLNSRLYLNISINLILSRINQDRYCFSHIYARRITFSSSFREMTYDHYLKQPMSMCEIRLNEILANNPNHKFIR